MKLILRRHEGVTHICSLDGHGDTETCRDLCGEREWSAPAARMSSLVKRATDLPTARHHLTGKEQSLCPQCWTVFGKLAA